jgi:putative transcriptional regulator
MTDEEVHAAAMADPDARPMTPEQMAKGRRVPRVKTLRRALGLTQDEFAARYHIPLGTLRDWEQGRTEPDQPARAYLRVIASDPDWVSHALANGHRRTASPEHTPSLPFPTRGRVGKVSRPDHDHVYDPAAVLLRPSGWRI